jgi:HTH-type transcriptional regulator/antitoxin HigA
MTIKPIRDEADYDAALAEIHSLMGVARGTPESDRLEVLVTLVERYEAEHWRIEAPDPVSAIHHVMEARGLRQKDLAALIGSQSHASEVLRRRRPLSLAMIRVLAAEWSLPADVLVREYELATG